MLCFQPRLEAIENFCLVLWAGHEGDCSGLDRDYWLMGIVVCELTAGAADTSGRSMRYDICSTSSSEPADRNELVDVVPATDDGDGKLIQKQERNAVVVVAVESGFTLLALDRWMALCVVGSRSSSIYWRHTERIQNG
ncbi:hypothetical protein GCM10027355_34440 [Haloplanus salinarum]